MKHDLQKYMISSYDQFLMKYMLLCNCNGNFVDGGAGKGDTSKKLLQIGKLTNLQIKVYAYEPFIGNHRFFEGLDSNIILKKCALADSKGLKNLAINAVIDTNSKWNKHLDLIGYSSSGHLTKLPKANCKNYTCNTVILDDDLQEDICFAKLDLQGGEYQALQGMQRHMQNKLDMMWIEYLFHPRYESYKIIDYLQSDYELFDTEYLFYGKPTILAHHHFNINKTKILSNDRLVYSGFKKIPWSNYKDETLFFVEKLNLIQTDILAIKKNKVNFVYDILNSLK